MGEMYKEYGSKVLAARPASHEAAAAPVSVHAVGATLLPESAPSMVSEPRNAEQQQAWLQAKAAAVGQHARQDQYGPSSSHRSDQTSFSQATVSQPQAASTSVPPSLFMPTAVTAQRGLDHKLRNDRRSADRGAPAVPKFAAPVTGSTRPKPTSPAHVAQPPQAHELVETDIFG